MTSPIVLVLVFIAASVVGYLVIRKIPSLLHTPLMSGMNALSGITLIGAILVVVDLLQYLRITDLPVISIFLKDYRPAIYFGIVVGGLAIILAMINVVGGFGVTHRMLRMFSKKKKGGEA